MGKTKNFFRKIKDIKGTFYATWGTIKDRNGKDETEAKRIQKRWQEYTKFSSVQSLSCVSLFATP